jgi:CheY-like chemotaxis protein
MAATSDKGVPANGVIRVLVVDDQPPVARAVRRLLGPEYVVAIELDALRALERLGAGEEFDVVLCDLRMPVLSGVEFLAHLEEQKPTMAMRLVFVTGGGADALAQSSAAVQRKPVLAKPFDAVALRQVVREVARVAPPP